MSFDLICGNCGAPSAPYVGTCPFCKSVLSSKDVSKESPALRNLNKLFNEGKLEQCLLLIKSAEKLKPELLKDANFVLLYVKLLIETDGPSSKLKSLISQALLENPEHQPLLEYLEIIDAKCNLSREKNDVGETELANILRRSPDNVHALFLLGSHLFWVENEQQKSLLYLERCHRNRPTFLRATACLAALYKKMGLSAQAKRLFLQCAALETSKDMKSYFKNLAT